MNYKDKFDYLPIEEVKGQGSFVKAVCFKPKKAPTALKMLQNASQRNIPLNANWI